MIGIRHFFRFSLIASLAIACCAAGHCVTISGRARNLESVGVGGKLVYGSGGYSAYTASDGSYSLTVPSGYSGAVEVLDDTTIHIPISYSYTNVVVSQTNKDFTVTPVQQYPATSYFYNPGHTTSYFGIQRGSIGWADYDNNGVLDVALAGLASTSGGPSATPLSRVFRQDSSGSGSVTFTQIADLTGVQDAALAWGDYDNDNQLDLLLTGDTGSTWITKLYHGTGSGFTEVSTGIRGITKGGVAWGDYNNDGRQDILIAGNSTSGRFAAIYRNAGGGVFSIVATVSPPGLSEASVAWADYDADGKLDFAIAGNSGAGYITRIYHNNGNGVFSDISAGLTGIASGSLAWGDYDNDGDLDLAFCGLNVGGTKITRIARNNGASFTETNPGIAGCQGQLAWGDCDNDGRLDLAVAGDHGTAAGGSIPRVYHNNGGGSFTGMFVGVVGVTNAAIAWGDQNADGRLDLLLAGLQSGVPATNIYQTISTYANTAPTAPTGLLSTYTSNTLTLSWNAATDSQTPQSGLTYNIRVGTSPGAGDVVSGMADYSNGRRRVLAMGNVQRSLSYTIQNLTPRTYYWSVQAIDGAFAGSPWAAERMVTVSTKPCFAVTTRGVYDYLMNTAFVNYIFTTWGKVTRIDANNFYLDDGSGKQVKVIYSAHGLSTGNCAWAKGTIDPSLNPRVLTANAIKRVY